MSNEVQNSKTIEKVNSAYADAVKKITNLLALCFEAIESSDPVFFIERIANDGCAELEETPATRAEILKRLASRSLGLLLVPVAQFGPQDEHKMITHFKEHPQDQEVDGNPGVVLAFSVRAMMKPRMLTIQIGGSSNRIL
jgi:hypothetical protein